MNDDGQRIEESAVRFERVVSGPTERVWDFLTSGERIAEWFGGGPMKYVILEMLDALLRGQTPETREAIMARNRIRYGVKELKR